VLVLDWWLRRRSGPAPRAAAGTAVDQQASAVEQPVEDAVPDDTANSLDQATEPDEEDTDAADLLVVTDLSVEVRVLDERPRYHLASCAWLGERASLGLPISEARQLGFTPCGVCRPDSTLAERKRASAL
jgi:hypothetical protein